ncbi:TlyA family RNA methyltransferase [Aquabacterium sp. A7-Y]|uniref:TlyA family RNA methyltransferase n=1 Tax=Aquabacterium sp. A7-Y TaxID=1349605 RepID=UPI00223E737B|nr:TlyA family RNA methyltransferase [Aquabacterium sp. A7-Y]MCW7539078.1 TlyA family RNA methyltransferase [Aquabacterium sp. A7-Y]
MRADQLLVSQGLAPSRSAAQRLIERAAVQWQGPRGWVPVRKAGEDLPEGSALQLLDDAELRFVSRGGLKLDGALAHTGLGVAGRDCLDVGQSTGGFTDVLLQRGAARVVGVDVGHGQLHPRLRNDPRVSAYEGVNAKDWSDSRFAEACRGQRFGLIVADLSFIPLTRVLPSLTDWLAPGGDALLLVKPQFEVGPEHVGKGGLVKDTRQYPLLEQRVRAACEALGWQVRDYFDSPIQGGDGNREFFVWARGAAPGA